MSRMGQGAVGALRNWLQANPHEWLTYSDLVLKFGFKNIDVAKQAVYVLKREGLVCSETVVFADPERPK